MPNFSADFLHFLETYYKGDYDLLLDPKTDAAKLNSIYNNHFATFEVWDKLPFTLKNRYGAEIPPDVREAALRDEYMVLREMEFHPEIKTVADARQAVAEKYDVPSDIIDNMAAGAFVAAIAIGYSLEAAHDLAAHRQFRESLRDKAIAGTMNEEEKKAWLESRENDIKTIHKEWHAKQPEKMLIHLIAKFNRGKITEPEMLPMLADLIQKIERDNRQGKLLEYLKQPRIQAKLAHFKPKALDILSNNVLHNVPHEVRAQFLNAVNSKNTDGLSMSQKTRLVANNLSAGQNRLPPERAFNAAQLREIMPSIAKEGKQSR